MIDVSDETSGRVGIRIVCVPGAGIDLAQAEVWVRSVWPVTTLVDCRLPAPMAGLLAGYRTDDPSGRNALEALLPRP